MRWTGAVVLSFTLAATAFADCGVERWPVKTASDRDAAVIGGNVIPTSIAALRNFVAPRPLPQSSRIAPVEITIYSITATLTELRLESDGDYRLVISDEAGRTMIAAIPSPSCVDASSPFASAILAARAAFEAKLPHPPIPIEVRGIGFFNYLYESRGAAPNGIELHPVVAINFTPLVKPQPPSFGRRRAASGGGNACLRPSLTITASRNTACGGDPLTLSWQASDPLASVTIDDLGTAMPASGSMFVLPPANVAYSGRATNACGTGAEAVAVVNVKTQAATSLFASPTSIVLGGNATLTLTTTDASSWTLASSLGNPLSRTSGTSNGTTLVNYTGSRSGTDLVTLSASGACGNVQSLSAITVGAPQPVPPPTPPTPVPPTPPPPVPPPTPPPNGGLLCCDGTRSTSCFSCSSKQGCCSSHKGVCGCP